MFFHEPFSSEAHIYWTCWQHLTVFSTTLLPSFYHHPEIVATHRDDSSLQARLLTPFYFCNSFVWPWPLSTPWLSSILPLDIYFSLSWCWELCSFTLSCSLTLSASPWLHSLSKDFQHRGACTSLLLAPALPFWIGPFVTQPPLLADPMLPKEITCLTDLVSSI